MDKETSFLSDESEFAPLAEINVTPFIDVMLVLLIIFMVTAPLLTSGMKVDLPPAAASHSFDDQPPVVVKIGPNGEIEVGGEPVTKDELVAAVRAKLKDDNHLLQIRGDHAASYGSVVTILDVLASNGLTKFGLVTRQVQRKSSEP